MPLSLFGDNGKIETTKKSEFLVKFEGLTDPETLLRTVKGVESIIFDDMAINHMLPIQTLAAKITYNNMALLFRKHDCFC